METYFLPKAFSTRNPRSNSHKHGTHLRRITQLLGFIPFLCLQLCMHVFSAQCDAATLQPYRAVYTTHYKGMSADATQTLTRDAIGQFTLKRDVSAMFVKISEQSQFTLQNNQLVTSRYTYKRGGLGSKKNIEQLFQWDKNNLHITENDHSRDVAIKPPLFDKLNYTEAMRMQLLAAGPLPKNISVPFADRHHLKQYDFVVGAQEDITTPVGKMRAVKLERNVPEEKKHAVIWVAPELDYLLVKLQQTDEDDSFELNLKSYEADKTATP